MTTVPGIDKARRAGALLLCLALASCADVPVEAPAAASLFVDASFAPSSVRMTAADVFKVSPEMHDYLEARVTQVAMKHGDALALVEALFTDRRVQVDYDSEFTRTAEQTFAARKGNCLSLAIVTGAMAKEFGLEVQYQSVDTTEHWERDGDLLMRVGHVNVTVGARSRTWGFNNDHWTVDFMPTSDLKGLVVAPISQSRVVAMFMNNRAAEALLDKHVDDAYWWARDGIAADPSFSSLYNTLGVIYLHKHLLPQADAAFRFAVARAPREQEAWSNLALALRGEGKLEEAALIEQAHPQTRAATLVAAIDDGLKANAAGDYERALDLFNRALRVSADSHHLHYLLAVTYLNLGDRGRAMEHLQLAEKDSTTVRQRSVYLSKMALLKSTTSGLRLDPNAAQQLN